MRALRARPLGSHEPAQLLRHTGIAGRPAAPHGSTPPRSSRANTRSRSPIAGSWPESASICRHDRAAASRSAALSFRAAAAAAHSRSQAASSPAAESAGSAAARRRLTPRRRGSGTPRVHRCGAVSRWPASPSCCSSAESAMYQDCLGSGHAGQGVLRHPGHLRCASDRDDLVGWTVPGCRRPGLSSLPSLSRSARSARSPAAYGVSQVLDLHAAGPLPGRGRGGVRAAVPAPRRRSRQRPAGHGRADRSGCASSWPGRVWTPAPTPSPGTWHHHQRHGLAGDDQPVPGRAGPGHPGSLKRPKSSYIRFARRDAQRVLAVRLHPLPARPDGTGIPRS